MEAGADMDELGSLEIAAVTVVLLLANWVVKTALLYLLPAERRYSDGLHIVRRLGVSRQTYSHGVTNAYEDAAPSHLSNGPVAPIDHGRKSAGEPDVFLNDRLGWIECIRPRRRHVYACASIAKMVIIGWSAITIFMLNGIPFYQVAVVGGMAVMAANFSGVNTLSNNFDSMFLRGSPSDALEKGDIVLEDNATFPYLMEVLCVDDLSVKFQIQDRDASGRPLVPTSWGAQTFVQYRSIPCTQFLNNSRIYSVRVPVATDANKKLT